MNYKLIPLAALLLAFTNAAAEETGALSLTSAATPLVSAEQSKSTVFHVNMPERSTLIATVYGGDEISSAYDSSNHVRNDIDGNSVTFQIGRAGQYSVSATTKCGLSFAVVINAVASTSESVDIREFLPKVAIQGASCDAVENKN